MAIRLGAFAAKDEDFQGPGAWRARLRFLAPFFVVGPISGPLLAGVVFNFRNGRPVLGTLYGIALVQFIILLPAFVAKAGLHLL